MNNQEIIAFYGPLRGLSTPETDRLIRGGFVQQSGGYISYARERGVSEPTQYWHLMRSWSDRSSPQATFGRNIRCGELIIYMAEAAGIDVSATVDSILEDPSRSRGNAIAAGLFDEIKARVEKGAV